MSVINITSENFQEEVLKSDKPGTFRFLGKLVRPLPDGKPCDR